MERGITNDSNRSVHSHPCCVCLLLRKVLLNLMHLGYKVLSDETVKTPKQRLRAKERPGEKYEVSRWTPLLQDIAEVAYTHTLYIT